MKRWCKRIGIGLLACGLACIVVYGYALFTTAGKLRQEAKDVSKPALVAHHDALVRARQSAASHHQEGDSPSAALVEDLERISAFEAFFDHIDGLPAMKSVYDFRRLLHDVSYRSLSDDAKIEMQAALVSVQPEVERLRELAADGGPLAALDFSIGLRLDYAHHLYAVRSCAAFLDLDLITKLDGGDSAGATADVVALLQLAEILAQEPHMMAQVTRHYDFLQRLFDTMKRHCSLEDFSEDELATLVVVLDGAGHREELADTLWAEQYLGYRGFEQLIRSGWGGRAGFLDRMFRDERDGTWTLSFVYLSPFFRPHHNNEMAAHLRLLGRAADAAAEPYFISKAKWDDIEQRYNAAPMGFLRLAYAQRIISLAGFQARCESGTHLLQIAMALTLYHRFHGVSPSELAAVSDLLPNGLPVDPFTGKAYRYKRGDDAAYVLYGAGWNLEDDGGNEEDKLVWRSE